MISIARNNQTTELQRILNLAWTAFQKPTDVFKRNLTNDLKRKTFDQSVLLVKTYGAETLTLTQKTTARLRVTQRRMEMLGLNIRNRVRNQGKEHAPYKIDRRH